ncbi:MAG: GNAT family N-acetyltransferase [Proteobacteria bacterium]|nr:GNAT family N-acetyltransferase [Pseudomonadota bacterium]MBU1716982.1 GNAT family N-acetyltransferase [Pseudomonadota bacterium]
MLQIKEYEDLDDCRQLWQELWPQKCLFDLWEVRYAFHKHYNNRPCFLVSENNGKPNGMLALSWLKKEQYFSHFPGETWQGKTWLEQNRILAKDNDIFTKMLAAAPGRVHLRYLTKSSFPEKRFTALVDETGYMFHPPTLDYSFPKYRELIPNKSRKKIDKELSRFDEIGVSFRHNKTADIALLFKLNLDAFGESSYFADSRFMLSFEELISFLSRNKMLRITTVLIGGKVAAIDLGAVWNKQYTVLAGGTSPEFPGVAKMINFHHLEWACRSHQQSVDFLCGDFGWKERFRLTPRPLFELRVNNPAKCSNNLTHRHRKVAIQ